MTRTVGIVAGSISGNKGAEAMVTTVVGLLRSRLQDARFILFSPYYKTDKERENRLPDLLVADGGPSALVTTTFPPVLLERILSPLGLRASRWFEPSRLLSRCDILVDVAGISFCDGREIFLPFNVLTILPAMMMGIPVAKLSQAMGPFRNRLNRACAHWLLPRCSYLVPRGARTARNLQSIGLDRPVGPDVTFALNDLADMRVLPDELAGYVDFGEASRPLVGIAPSAVVFKNSRKLGLDYVGMHARFADRLVAKGHRVLLLPHSMRPNTRKLRNNDLPVVRAIADAIGRNEQVRIVERDFDSIALRRLIGRCDLFLTSRFHAMVGALAMEVPVMVCAWGHKYSETLDMFGLGEYALDYRSLTHERLDRTFDRLSQNHRRVRDSIRDVLPSFLTGARRQIDAVAAMLRDQV